MFLFRRSKNALRSVTMKPDLKISKIDKTVYKLLNWLVAMTQMKPQTKEYHKEGNDNNAYTHHLVDLCGVVYMDCIVCMCVKLKRFNKHFISVGLSKWVACKPLQ